MLLLTQHERTGSSEQILLTYNECCNARPDPVDRRWGCRKRSNFL